MSRAYELFAALELIIRTFIDAHINLVSKWSLYTMHEMDTRIFYSQLGIVAGWTKLIQE